MKKRRYHIIRYADSCYYHMMYITSMDEFERPQYALRPLKVKLIRIFDDRAGAVAFAKAINML